MCFCSLIFVFIKFSKYMHWRAKILCIAILCTGNRRWFSTTLTLQKHSDFMKGDVNNQFERGLILNEYQKKVDIPRKHVSRSTWWKALSFTVIGTTAEHEFLMIKTKENLQDRVVVSYPNYNIYISIFDAYVMKVIQLPMVGYGSL